MNNLRTVIKGIEPYMRNKGFILAGNNFYRIANDIAYCVALDMPSGLIYSTAYIMPLYIPCNYRYYTYGYKLNYSSQNALPLLRKSFDTQALCAWSEKLCRHIEEKVIPFFSQIGTPKALSETLTNKRHLLAEYFTCAPVFSQRLLAYTYLYLREFDKASFAIADYRDMLLSCTHLTKTTVQKYLDEVSVMQTLTDAEECEITTFFDQTAKATRIVLGDKGTVLLSPQKNN